MTTLKDKSSRRKSRVRRSLTREFGNAAAAVRAPLVEAHLRAGDRRRRRQDGRCRLHAGEGRQGLAQDRRRQGGCSAVGKLVAERAIKAGVTDVVFDRGGYLYHGRVKALADAAREGGLKF